MGSPGTWSRRRADVAGTGLRRAWAFLVITWTSGATNGQTPIPTNRSTVHPYQLGIDRRPEMTYVAPVNCNSVLFIIFHILLVAVTGVAGISCGPPNGGDGTQTIGKIVSSVEDNEPVSGAGLSLDDIGGLSLPGYTFRKVPYNAELYDSKGQFDPSTSRFTAAEPGDYFICASLTSYPADTAHGFELDLLINGNRENAFANATQGGGFGQGCRTVRLQKNDYVEIGAHQESTGTMQFASNPYWNWLTIDSVSGAVSADNATPFVAENNAFTKVPYVSEIYDDGGHFSADTGRFAAPGAGDYTICASLLASASTSTSGFEIDVFINGNREKAFAGATVGGAQHGCRTVRLAMSDLVDLRVYQGSGTSMRFGANDIWNWLTINRSPPTVYANDVAPFLAPSGKFTKILYSDPRHDEKGQFNSEQSRFVAAEDGEYSVCASLTTYPYSTSTGFELDLFIDGQRENALGGYFDNHGFEHGCRTVRLKAGSYLEVWLNQQSGSPMTFTFNAYWNWMTVTKLHSARSAGSPCLVDSDCDQPFVCGSKNGARFGKDPNDRFCWPVACSLDPSVGCGALSAPCGLCPESVVQSAVCTPNCTGKSCGGDVDDGCGGMCPVCQIGEPCRAPQECSSGLKCGLHNGARYNRAEVDNVCWPPSCELNWPSPAPCGAGTSCGSCPACASSCLGKACGGDGCGGTCGTCGAGQYCTADGQCAPSVPIYSGNAPQPLPTTVTSAVGATKGMFDVDLLGNATYTIPLEVPPGIVKPSLALVYNSSSGNGPVGFGWSLVGAVSRIARCPKIYARDSQAAPTMSADDRFCLDGVALISTQAEPPVYRTEVDQAARIMPLNPQSRTYGPDAFEVRRKDGLIYLYDNYVRTDFRLDSLHDSWILRRVSDRSGNFMEFSVLNKEWTGLTNTREEFPQGIKYGGNLAGTSVVQAPHVTIEFQYEDRDDRELLWRRFDQWKLDRRLKRIVEKLGDRTIRAYELSYDNDSARTLDKHPVSRLTSVVECAPVSAESSNLVCKSPTTFTYEDDPVSLATKTSPYACAWDPLVTNYRESLEALRPLLPPLVLDMDGDGFDDMLSQVFDAPSGDSPLTRDTVNAAHWELLRPRGLPSVTGSASGGVGIPDESRNPQTNFAVVDVNNDGRDELLQRSWFGDGTYKLISLAETNDTFVVQDTNIPFKGSAGIPQSMNWTVASATYVLDVNGDGVRDIVTCSSPAQGDTSEWFYAALPVRSPTAFRLRRVNLNQGCFQHHLALDLDGDGAEELLIQHYTSMTDQRMEYDAIKFDNVGAEQRTGDVTTSIVQTGVPVDSSVGVYGIPLDANGDGLTDIAVVRPDLQELWTYINRGSGLDTSRVPITPRMTMVLPNAFERPSRLLAGQAFNKPNGTALKVGPVLDMDGDGRDDILVYPEGEASAGWLVAGANSVTGEFGGFTYVTDSAIIPNNPVGGRAVAADINGDGIKDLVTKPVPTRAVVDGKKELIELGEPGHFYAFLREGPSGRKLRSAVDGLGNVTTVVYAPLTNAALYSASSSCGWPYLCKAPRYPAVYSATESNYPASIPANDLLPDYYRRRFEYYYAGARQGAGGRGRLGFQSVLKREPDRDAEEYREFSLSTVKPDCTACAHILFPYVGMPVYQESNVGVGGGRLTRISVSVLQSAELDSVETSAGGAPLRIAMPFLAQAWETRRESQEGSVFLERFTENLDVDSYGNIKTQVVHWRDGSGNDLETESVVTSFAYEDTPQLASDWLIALPRASTVTSAVADGTQESRTEAFDYDSAGRLKTRTLEPDRNAYKLTTGLSERDRFGNAQKIQTAGTGATYAQSLTYDAHGIFLEKVVDEEGYVTRYVFDNATGALVETSRRGIADTGPAVSYSIAVDAFGRPSVIQPPGVAASQVSYQAESTPHQGLTAHGIRMTSTQSRGGTASVLTDSRGRVLETSATTLGGVELKALRTYDPYGNLHTESRATVAAKAPGPTAEYAYDHASRPTSVRLPDGAVIDMCYVKNVACTKDQRGAIQCEIRDYRGRLSGISDPVIGTANTTCESQARLYAAPASFDGVHYSYGPFGALTSILDRTGRGVSIVPDAFGRPKSRTVTGIGTTNYTLYDGFGRLREWTDPAGNHFVDTYDGLSRLTRRDMSGGVTPSNIVRSTSWVWKTDLQDRLSWAPGAGDLGDSSLVMAYDSRGRESSVAHRILGEELVFNVEERDALGRPTIVKYPAPSNAGMLRIRNVYDDYGNLIEVRNADGDGRAYWKVSAIDDFGEVKTETLGNGLVTSRTYYDATGCPKTISSGAAHNESYVYQPNGSLDSRTMGQDTAPTIFQYDALDRLEHVARTRDSADYLYDYDYDAVGNLRFKGGLAARQKLRFSYDDVANPHRLSSVSEGAEAPSFAYDENGNVKTQPQGAVPGLSIQYTASNRPSRISGASGASFQYGYNAFDELVAKKGSSSNGNSTLIIVPGLYYREDVAGSRKHHFVVWNGARPVAEIVRTEKPDGTYSEEQLYLHDDRLGSIAAITAADGQIAESREFDPYGGLPAGTGFRSLLGYTGQLHDPDFGLVFMGARVYEPSLGRFLQPDPIVGSGRQTHGLNPYEYALDNPIRYVDRSGYEPEGAGAGGPGFGGGGIIPEGGSWDGYLPAGTFPAPGLAFDGRLMLTQPSIAVTLQFRVQSANWLEQGNGWEALIARGANWDAWVHTGEILGEVQETLTGVPYDQSYITLHSQGASFRTGMMWTVMAIELALAASSVVGAVQLAITAETVAVSGRAAWTNVSRGLQTRRIGDFWVKRVNPGANSLMRAWGQHSLRTQARALDKLGDLAVPHSFRGNMLFTQHAGGSPSFGTWARTWLNGTARIGFPNDIRPWNMGANGLVFDPALDVVDKTFLIGGSGLAIGGSLYGVGVYYGAW